MVGVGGALTPPSFQATWAAVVGTQGPEIVASVITEVVEYYTLQSDADNHAVREAACHCIAELPHKVSSCQMV